MNKTELISAVAYKSGLTKKASGLAVNAMLAAVIDTLVDGAKVQLAGFGSFQIKTRTARTGRNPRTKAPVDIPASKHPVFRAGKALKDAVAGSNNGY